MSTIPPPGGYLRNKDAHFRTLRVLPRLEPDMYVTITGGIFWMNGTKYREIATTDVGPFTAPGSNSKIDVVCLTYNGLYEIVTGTAGIIPNVPDIPQRRIALALIYIPAGLTKIIQDNVWDVRDVMGSSIFSFDHGLLSNRNSIGQHSFAAIGSGNELDQKVDKVGNEDIEITSATKGIVLKAPNATRYRITVDNSGSLIVTAI